MVGDNRHDLEMARAGGAGLAVGVLSGTGTRETLAPMADVILDSIADLPGLSRHALTRCPRRFAFVSDTKATIFAAAAGQTSSSETWDGSTTKFKLAVSFTPQQAGWVISREGRAQCSNLLHRPEGDADLKRQVADLSIRHCHYAAGYGVFITGTARF